MAALDTPLNPSWGQYQPEALVACKRVLGTLVMALGGQDHPQLVVVGGLVPHLLLGDSSPDPLMDPDPHPGTNDIDFCVQLDVRDDDAELYQDLERVLREYRFERAERHDGNGLSVWQWVRTVDGIPVAVEFLAPADGVETHTGRPAVGRMARAEPTKQGDQIGALRIRGAGLAHAEPQPTVIEIELLDGAGTARVNVWVANVLPFIVLKSFALRGRQKDKDAFDLVWVLMHWPNGGPEAAAREAIKSPVVNDPDVEVAMGYLRDAFGRDTDHGCVRFANFRLGANRSAASDAERKRRARDARGAVAAFLKAWQDLRAEQNAESA